MLHKQPQLEVTNSISKKNDRNLAKKAYIQYKKKFFKAIINNNYNIFIAILEVYLNKEKDINIYNKNKMIALHITIYYQNATIVILFLKVSVDSRIINNSN